MSLALYVKGHNSIINVTKKDNYFYFPGNSSSMFSSMVNLNTVYVDSYPQGSVPMYNQCTFEIVYDCEKSETLFVPNNTVQTCAFGIFKKII